jgi:hypothetical protein
MAARRPLLCSRAFRLVGAIQQPDGPEGPAVDGSFLIQAPSCDHRVGSWSGVARVEDAVVFGKLTCARS